MNGRAPSTWAHCAHNRQLKNESNNRFVACPLILGATDIMPIRRPLSGRRYLQVT